MFRPKASRSAPALSAIFRCTTTAWGTAVIRTTLRALLRVSRLPRAYHIRYFSIYELLTPDGTLVVAGTKQGFCFEDSFKYEDGGKSQGYDCTIRGARLRGAGTRPAPSASAPATLDVRVCRVSDIAHVSSTVVNA